MKTKAEHSIIADAIHEWHTNQFYILIISLSIVYI